MDLSTLANLINAFAVTAALIFAGVQISYYRQRRRREAMLELVRSFQSPSFASAFRRVISLPDQASKLQVSELLGADGEDATHIVGLTWESLGVLVFRREVTLDLVDDFFSGPILVSWRKLSRYVSEQRAILQRDTAFEWFQWLAERMMERESKTPPVPAHIGHRNWKRL
jgi:hypothetical protein